MSAACTSRPGYLDNATLARLVRLRRRTRRVSDELVRALTLIAAGVWDRWRFTTDKDDFVQECLTHLVLGSPIKRVDPAGNLFSYFTTCCVRVGNKLRDKEMGYRRRLDEYRHHQAGELRYARRRAESRTPAATYDGATSGPGGETA